VQAATRVLPNEPIRGIRMRDEMTVVSMSKVIEKMMLVSLIEGIVDTTSEIVRLAIEARKIAVS
jgi:hypothetical protein